MNKNGIKQLVQEELERFLPENGFELYDVDFVKEGKDYFLRVLVDKKKSASGELQYMSTDDCEIVSRYLSKVLDEKDPIEQNYYLEVSSPGLDRELKKDEHFERYAGESVDVKLYQKWNGKKEITATLLSKNSENLILKEDGEKFEIPMKNIAKISLTVVF